ncbi:MAG: glucokinase [Deltaproteobacteria bacterium GWC2_56_8]|nr:MAG: glucokinase [Deltaproteobacteria bacterium GWB2_55_19]OGP37407.1 MAG: glucokinase [Deltaproteobacteria bacterium GWC2_56_8]
MGLILAGDIGGTNTRLGLFEDMGTSLRPLHEESFANAAFTGPEEVIKRFLPGNEAVSAASFGIACPVEEGACRLTNFPWLIDARAIGERFGIGKTALINDLVAIAWGLPLLKDKDLYTLQKGERRDGNIALIAAGTGLGEAVLFRDGDKYVPSPSEGGHADFAPRNSLEIGLLEHLIGEYGRVSYERVVSGPGIVNIYNFIKTKGKAEPGRIRMRLATDDPSAVITEEGMAGSDGNCTDALALFLSIYGAEAGNLALKALSIGGVFVAGGIAPKVLKAFEKPCFIEAFRAKGRLEGLLSKIPVHVVMDCKAGLTGAAAHAAGLLTPDDKRRVVRVG